MRTIVNPGRLLVCEGSFDVSVIKGTMVVERESEQPMTLWLLLRSFLEDPSETVTGPIRITIEAAS